MSAPLEVYSSCCLLKFCRERFKTLSLTDLNPVVCARQWHEHTRRDHRDGGDDNRGYDGGVNGGDGSGWW